MKFGDDSLNYKPVGYSCRVDRNVWAGEYPVWEWDPGARIRQLELFTGFGINSFLDLTESGEMLPYALFLRNGIDRYSFPVKNGGVPDNVQSVIDLFRHLDNVFKSGHARRLYVHCAGGVGRTGMIVACYYVYFKGMGSDDAISEMRRRYAFHGRSAWMSAPETQSQVDFVTEFAEALNFEKTLI